MKLSAEKETLQSDGKNEKTTRLKENAPWGRYDIRKLKIFAEILERRFQRCRVEQNSNLEQTINRISEHIPLVTSKELLSQLKTI